ncbi:hypothetical protein ACFPOB_21180, partial [Bosea eneae]
MRLFAGGRYLSVFAAIGKGWETGRTAGNREPDKKSGFVEKLSFGLLTGARGCSYKAAIETAPPLAGPLY